jgi:23S rRNA pseudouridine955/2504/2580 synthase
MERQQRIGREDDGIRLDRWFKRHYPALTHSRLEKLLRTGQVRIDGSRAKSNDRLASGQMLRLPPLVTEGDLSEKPRPAVPVMAGSLQDFVLYMDASVIVINKPPGLATQGGSGLTKHVDGMLDSLMYDKKQRPRLVHRLDRDTSGVLVIARTVSAAAALAKSLQDRDASKIYWALTNGVPSKRKGTIRGALIKEGGHGIHGRDEKMAVSEDEDAKPAMTDYMVMGTAGDEFAWVAAKPVTGRTHQIRVHLASIGTPIVGDFKYGGTEAKAKGAIADKLHLHARAINIAHPDGGRIEVSAPVPAHIRASFELLGFDPDAEPEHFSFKKIPKKQSVEEVFVPKKTVKKKAGVKPPKKLRVGKQQPRKKKK